MLTISLQEPAPLPFDFEAAACSHGWMALSPFAWDAASATLARVHQLNSGKVVRLGMRRNPQNGSSPHVEIEVETVEALTLAEEAEVRSAVRRMLRLDEDFSEFYNLYAQTEGWSLRLQPGGGRLLRCPNLFEDIVYTLCTTNITWSGTKRLVERLTSLLGEPFPGREEWRAFPTPTAIAVAGPQFLKEEIRLGYRSAYIWEIASAVAEGRLDLSALEDPTQPTETLLRMLRQIKGVGPYAAATLLMILGRYEYLAIDTELHAHVSKKYFQGQPATEAQIRALYAPWGKWQYLAYWFDPPAEATAGTTADR
jgi:3-methyladenine DNA glycosylase/8-oxoguanine DNA glycosylase